jgi:hypothetical protein
MREKEWRVEEERERKRIRQTKDEEYERQENRIGKDFRRRESQQAERRKAPKSLFFFIGIYRNL